MSPYVHVAPQHDLPDESARALRAAMAARDDIRAAYWITTIYEREEGTVAAQDELHIELLEPPEQAASLDQYRELSQVIPVNGLVYVISSQATLADIRKVGLRVV